MKNMAYRVDISIPALIDAENAFLFIRKDAPEAAKDWYENLLKTIFTLENFPLRCAVAPEGKDLNIEIRQLLYGKNKHSFRILFGISVDAETGENVVRIYRIRHGSRRFLENSELFGDAADDEMFS